MIKYKNNDYVNNQGKYEVDILLNGKTVKEYTHNLNGEQKTLIEARDNSKYSVRIKNNGYNKILAIVAIDGLNCVSGKKCDGSNDRGYIIPVGEQREIKGWRISDNEVSSFRFSDKSKSYATSKGLENNAGVISVNIIEEKQSVYVNMILNNPPNSIPYISPWNPWQPPYFGNAICANTFNDGHTSLNSVFYSAQCSSNQLDASNDTKKSFSNFNMGTKFGEKESDCIERVGFDKGDIVATFNIYYTSREGLKNLGVKLDNKKEVDLPDGFEEYCKPPAGWNGNNKAIKY